MLAIHIEYAEDKTDGISAIAFGLYYDVGYSL